MIKQKFQEVKQLVASGYTSQAQDECDNGVSICNEAKNASTNLMLKLHEAFGDAEILHDLQNFFNEQFDK